MRLVLVEPGGGQPLIVRVSRQWKAVVAELPRLDGSEAARYAADAQVHVRAPGIAREEFLARRTRPPYDAAFYVPSRRFRARGPDLVLLLHPWRPAGEPVQATWRDGAYRVPAEPLGPLERVSWEILVPPSTDLQAFGKARADGRSIDLYWSRRQKRFLRYLTPRVRPPDGATEWVLSFDGAAAPSAIEAVAHRWAPPESMEEAVSRE